MARMAKSGLEYFPFDIDFFQDIRIRKLIKRQGGKAVTVYALLLCLIYKDGYYMKWDEELPFIGSEMSGFEEAYISEVIKSCLSLGLFNKKLYDSEQVLTSKGIQVRYCNIQRLNKRMSRIDKYSLLDEPDEAIDDKKTVEPKNETKAETAPQSKKAAKVTAQSDPTMVVYENKEGNAEWLRVFFSEPNRENLQLLCKNLGLGRDGIEHLRSLADAVIGEWELSQTLHRDYSDWSRHLISAMRIKNRDISDNSKSKTKTSAPSDYTYSGGFGSKDS